MADDSEEFNADNRTARDVSAHSRASSHTDSPAMLGSRASDGKVVAAEAEAILIIAELND